MWVNVWTVEKIMKNLMSVKIFQLEKNIKNFMLMRIFEMKKKNSYKNFDVAEYFLIGKKSTKKFRRVKVF